ncbi:PASTA domain-containing protein [Actinophytocola glycyrrhizae]|uniref:PASTA domain-containing protein n=1 Tax=Actinophytocola glycyrrhizae TaxID=2044873 RepID=A0ABV9RW35_9PSEU
MRVFATLMSSGACVVAVLATSGCGGESSPEQELTTTAPPAQTEEQATTEPAAEPPATEQWAMPNLAGMTLQDAQDQIQALTGGAIYFTDSHDLGGQDRNQVLDANWQVCTQNVGPGATLTTTSRIDLGVVKLDEACP